MSTFSWWVRAALAMAPCTCTSESGSGNQSGAQRAPCVAPLHSSSLRNGPRSSVTSPPVGWSPKACLLVGSRFHSPDHEAGAIVI